MLQFTTTLLNSHHREVKLIGIFLFDNFPTSFIIENIANDKNSYSKTKHSASFLNRRTSPSSNLHAYFKENLQKIRDSPCPSRKETQDLRTK